MKKALLIISHGSRRAASNEEVHALTQQIRERAGGLRVECCFLEITEPTVQQQIDCLYADGFTEIEVFPHFLAAGAHVVNDIPHELQTAKEHHPKLSFQMLPHLGALSELPGLILETISG